MHYAGPKSAVNSKLGRLRSIDEWRFSGGSQGKGGEWNIVGGRNIWGGGPTRVQGGDLCRSDGGPRSQVQRLTFLLLLCFVNRVATISLKYLCMSLHLYPT